MSVILTVTFTNYTALFKKNNKGHITLKKYIQTRTEELYNRHTATDVSLCSPHGTGATGTAGTSSY